MTSHASRGCPLCAHVSSGPFRNPLPREGGVWNSLQERTWDHREPWAPSTLAVNLPGSTVYRSESKYLCAVCYGVLESLSLDNGADEPSSVDPCDHRLGVNAVRWSCRVAGRRRVGC